MPALRVVSREKLADTETPVSAYIKLCRGRSDSFLLESVETKDVTGRYSIVAFDPISGMELSPNGVVSWDDKGETTSAPENFFQLIKGNLKRLEFGSHPKLPSVGSLMGPTPQPILSRQACLPPSPQQPVSLRTLPARPSC